MAAALLSCLAAVAVRPHALGAQDSPLLHEPVSATQALDALRRATTVGKAFASHRILAVLSQKNRSYSRAVLDSLADGLARLIIEAPPASLDALHGLVSLSLAGSPQARVPYPRTFELLVRIYEEANDPGNRAAAMRAVYRLTDKERALQFWAQIAQGINVRFLGAEHFAVSDLADLGGERGREILRELHARDLVREPGARAYLQWLASRNFVPLSPGQPNDTGAAASPGRRPLPPRKD